MIEHVQWTYRTLRSWIRSKDRLGLNGAFARSHFCKNSWKYSIRIFFRERACSIVSYDWTWTLSHNTLKFAWPVSPKLLISTYEDVKISEGIAEYWILDWLRNGYTDRQIWDVRLRHNCGTFWSCTLKEEKRKVWRTTDDGRRTFNLPSTHLITQQLNL